MKALLLAAGLGTRLRPLTDNTPKCLVPIGGRPLLDYWLHSLFSNGIESILINLHYHEKLVLNFLNKSQFKDRIDTVYEPELLGTAGTIAKNLEYFKGEKFLVAHADNFCVCNFNDFKAAHNSRPPETKITMMTFNSPNPEQCGVIDIDENQVVQRYFEKVDNPPSGLANAAVYIFEDEVGKFCSKLSTKNSDVSLHVVPKFLGRIFAWQNINYHIDIGTPENYAAANNQMIELKPTINKLGWFESDLSS
jgi:mannose-1-phosphate guanylyltransferase